MSLESGTKLAHYEILEPIGKGGMGEVYRAKDSKLGRDVAIKVLPEEFSQDEERLARFKREAKVLASLNHPRIAAIYGLEEADGTHFLVLELVQGETLEERIRRGPIPVAEVLAISSKIADALGEAHEQGVVHRDLKPANIMLTPDDDEIKVLDFGLAKALSEDATEADVASSMSPTITRAGTRLGVILGTAAYMSPEQAKGKRVDRRTDVFAFGSVLYEMLTGHKAFEGDVVSEVIASVLAREPDMSRLPANLNPRLRELLARCLEKDPKKRWQAVGDLRVEIDTVAEDPDGGLVPMATSAGIGVRGHVVWALIVAAAVAAALTATRVTPTPDDPVRRFVLEPQRGQRLATNPLPGNDLALSPDGARLAYAAVEDGVQQLFLRPMDAFAADAIPDTVGGHAPFFSPDGQWLGFFVGSVLYKVQIPGGTPLRVEDIGRPTLAGASWGPDDTILVGLRAQGLARVSASGGEVEIVAEPDIDRGESGYLWPDILPGARAAVFTVMHGTVLRNARLALIRLDTGERQPLRDDEGYAAQYVSTGHLIYGRAGIVMAVPFDLENDSVSGAPIQMLRDVFTKQAGAQSIAVSEDGSLAFIPGGGTEERRLVWVDRNGNANPVDGAPSHNYDGPRLSPNRDRIVVRVDEEQDVDILIYDFERSALTEVARTVAASFTPPVWTPDGERITFMAHDGSLQWKLADGSGPAEVLLVRTQQGDLNPVAWLPDGTALAYYNDVGLFLLRDGTDEEVFLQSAQPNVGQSFSPDGRFLAYASSESGPWGNLRRHRTGRALFATWAD